MVSSLSMGGSGSFYLGMFAFRLWSTVQSTWLAPSTHPQYISGEDVLNAGLCGVGVWLVVWLASWIIAERRFATRSRCRACGAPAGS